MKNTKKLNMWKRVGTGYYFVFWWQLQCQFFCPWIKHKKLCLSFIWDGFSFWLRRSHNLVSWVSFPPVGYLFQSYGGFVYASCMTNLYKVIICYHSQHESCFCSREVNLSHPFCGVSWLIFQSAISILSVSGSITSVIWSLNSCDGLRRSSMNSCWWVCLLSTSMNCSENKPRVTPWPYLHHW